MGDEEFDFELEGTEDHAHIDAVLRKVAEKADFEAEFINESVRKYKESDDISLAFEKSATSVVLSGSNEVSTDVYGGNAKAVLIHSIISSEIQDTIPVSDKNDRSSVLEKKSQNNENFEKIIKKKAIQNKKFIPQTSEDEESSVIESLPTKVPIPSKPLMATTTIEEGDESEEERIELEELAIEEKLKEDIDLLEEEWKNVNDVVVPNCITQSEIIMSPVESTTATPAHVDILITYEILIEYLRLNSNLSQYEGEIRLTEESKSTSFLSMFQSSNLKYSPALHTYDSKNFPISGFSKENHKLPFLLALVDYNPADQIHFATMKWIYEELMSRYFPTNHKFNIGSIGNHWVDIGFQGSDPRTDVNRAMKMLAILQMVHLIQYHGSYAKMWHELSQSYVPSSAGKPTGKDDKSWPFMCVSIMFTKEAIQALRNGTLNDKCTKYNDFFKVLNGFHHGCFVEFISQLKANSNLHHAEVLAKVRKTCQISPLTILRNSKTLVDNATSNSIETFQGVGMIKASNTTGEEQSNSYSWGKLFGNKKSKEKTYEA